MIRRWIQELRHKPKPVRDRVALSIAGSATAFVFLSWLYVTPGKLGEVATEVREQPGTFSLLFDRVREQTAAVVDGVNAFNRDAAENNEEIMVPTSTMSHTLNTAAATSTTTASSSIPTTNNTRAIRIATTTASSTE